MKNSINEINVSVIVLTYNGLSDYLKYTFEMIKKQACSFEYEIIIIDSSSTDGTVEFIKRQDNVIFHQIEKKNFGHGKTRQLGVEIANGEYVVFVSQDATPINNQWLETLFKKIKDNQEIVAVSSRILPRDNALAIRKYSILSEWPASTEDFIINDIEKGEYKMHDVSAIYRKDFLIKYKFDDVEFGEDVLIAKKALKNGFKIAFSAKSIVEHSHGYAIIPVYKRNVIDGRFNRKYLQRDTITSVDAILNKTYLLIKRDLQNLIHDNISLFQKIINIVYSPLIHLAEAFGQYKGNNKL